MSTIRTVALVAVVGAAAAFASNSNSNASSHADAALPAVEQAAAASQAAQTLPEKREITTGGGRGGGMLAAGIMVGNTLYLSGQLPAGGLRDSGVDVQTRSSIERSKAILEAAGLGLADVVSVQAYLVDIADYAAFNRAYMEMFTATPRPTRTTVVVKELVQGAKVELTMTAVKTRQP